MKKLLFFLFLIPAFSFSQTTISVNFIERTNAKKKTANILDLSIGSFINNNLIVGITNEKAVADYIIVMKDGKIIEEGYKKNIMSNPKNEYTKKLLSASL